MICNFIIYNKSKRELGNDDYRLIISDMIDKMLIYYITLSKVYSKIIIKLRDRYTGSKITKTGNDYSKVYKIPTSKYMYLK